MLDYIRIACAVPPVRVGDVTKNVEDICARLAEADAKEADLLVFPEMALTGYTCADLFFQQTLLDAAAAGQTVKVVAPAEETYIMVPAGVTLDLNGNTVTVGSAASFGTIIDSKNVNFYAYAGGAVEKCISDKYSVLNTSIIHKEKVSGFQWSANVGIGVGFKLGEHLGLYIDPSLRYYFDNGQPKSIRIAQPLTFGLEMGLRIRL